MVICYKTMIVNDNLNLAINHKTIFHKPCGNCCSNLASLAFRSSELSEISK